MPKTAFKSVRVTDEEYHIVPDDDDFEHALNGECMCGPDLIPEPEGMLYRHHSLDGREVDGPSDIDTGRMPVVD